jgi:protein-S-isoprenylcysteine O-methyltransferase Ste14
MSMSSSSGTTSAASLLSSETIEVRARRRGKAALARQAAAARIGHLVYRVRDALFPIVLLTIAFGTRPSLSGGSVATDHLVDAIGIGVALLGESLRVLVIGLVYITRGGQNRQVWANSLVDTGMFAHSRNPLYVANLLLFVGLAIVHNGWAMYLLVVPFFVFAYVCIVAAEEQYLYGRFGEAYSDYCRRVPRWLPSLRGLSNTLRSTEFDWLKVLRKEYGTPFAWTSGVLILLVWEHYGAAGASPLGQGELAVIIAIWIVLAVAYLTVRTLKLSGRLGTT